MKNKGRRHKSGNGPYANGNCKGHLCGITRPIEQMGSPEKKYARKMGYEMDTSSKKWMKKKWIKRVRGYFKSKTKKIFGDEGE